MPLLTAKVETWICPHCPFRWDFTEAAQGASPYDQSVMDSQFPGVPAGHCPACYSGRDYNPETDSMSGVPKRNQLGKEMNPDAMAQTSVASVEELAERQVGEINRQTGEVEMRLLTDQELAREAEVANRKAEELAAVAVQEIPLNSGKGSA